MSTNPKFPVEIALNDTIYKGEYEFDAYTLEGQTTGDITVYYNNKSISTHLSSLPEQRPNPIIEAKRLLRELVQE